jgi:hypothetical protein
MLRAVDAAFIGVHQDIVNLAGKPTLWWGRWIFRLAVLVAGIRLGMAFKELPLLLACLVALFNFMMCRIMWRDTRSEVMWSFYKTSFWFFGRVVLLVMFLVFMAMTFFDLSYTPMIVHAQGAIYVCFSYFGACNNPPPPRPRFKAATNLT